MKAGVPQGSVLGPIMGNVIYHCVLRLRRVPRDVRKFELMIIALVIRVKYFEELVTTCNGVGIVLNWIMGIGIELADHNADVLLVTSRKKIRIYYHNGG